MKYAVVERLTGSSDSGLFGRLRPLFYIALCLFLTIQFSIVVKLAIRQIGPMGAFEALRFPVEYLCPLLVGIGFRAYINLLEQGNVVQTGTANSIRDWIVALVALMYGSLLDVGRLLCPK